jgi:hypothetical protein
MTTNRISAAIHSVYSERPPFNPQAEHGDAMSAEWSIPLHRCLRRIWRLRKLLPEHEELLIRIARDLDGAINATRPLVRKLGIDTSSPLRRKSIAAQPQPGQPDLPPSARPIRAGIAAALVRMAAAIAPCSTLPDSPPVAPANETPKGPNP